MDVLVLHCFLSEMAFSCSFGVFFFFYFILEGFWGASVVLYLHLFGILPNWILAVRILQLPAGSGHGLLGVGVDPEPGEILVEIPPHLHHPFKPRIPPWLQSGCREKAPAELEQSIAAFAGFP